MRMNYVGGDAARATTIISGKTVSSSYKPSLLLGAEANIHPSLNDPEL